MSSMPEALHVPGSEPAYVPITALSGFEGQDFRSFLDGRAERYATLPCLIWEPFAGAGAKWSYGEFAYAIKAFAAGLYARGIRPGERVLVHFDNCPEAIIAWLGCAYCGAVAVTTNARSTGHELAYFASHSRAVAAVTQPAYAGILAEATVGLRFLAVCNTDSGVPATKAVPASCLAFTDIPATPNALPPRRCDPMAPFGIQYTSGTTSRPKAVLWTHANFLWGASVSALHEGLRSDDVHLVFMPLFHTNAQIYSIAAALWVGAAFVLQPKFSASRFWPVSVRHGCTWSSMVPFCAKALMELPVPAGHNYRFFGNGVCEPPWDKVLGVRTIGWWGMTETITHGSVGSLHGIDAAMSMGRPSPAYDLIILDSAGRAVGPDETGELYLRGQRGVSLFAEYVDDPEATAKSFTADGLFITGDRVRLGRDGFLYFADRSKDMLKVGGENVAASEIERVILETGGVSEVAVVAAPHPMLGEVPVAFLIAAPGAGDDLADRISTRCRDRLASYKWPQEIRIVPSLPRAALEKVAKAELRKTLISGISPEAG